MFNVQTRYLFHTDIKIKIPEKYGEDIFDDLFSILETINSKYNSYSKDSFIDKINKNSGKFVKVDNETIDILKNIIYFSDKLNQEYDITIMPLIKVWGFYKKNNIKVPTEKELIEAQKLVNYKNIEINEEKLEIKIGLGQEIITGSFIKSYAIDKVIKKMKEIGIKDAIINAGGSSIVSIGDWEVIVENPENKKKLERDKNGIVKKILNEKYIGNDEFNDLFEINLKNKAYSTSNQANTFLKINGKKYGHIISPKTCYPSENKQIGLITKNAFIGDIISTGLYNQTPENFYKIIKNLQKEIEIEGFLIDKDGKIHYTSKFLQYIKK